ncbi:NYN domain-containing protein [Rhizobium sp.]
MSGIRRLAILIDGDNVSPDAMEHLFAKVADLGHAVIRIVYGSQADKQKWLDASTRFALSQGRRHLQATGRNATDIEMVIGAMDLLTRHDLDGFCLVSSDSDFTSLAIRIRENGKAVFGFGHGRAPQSLQHACDSFHTLGDVQDAALPLTAKPANKSPKKKRLPPEQAIPRLRAAFEAAEDNGWVGLSEAANYLALAHPGFSTKTYGSKGFKKLVKACGAFELGRVNDRDVFRPLQEPTLLKLVKP